MMGGEAFSVADWGTFKIELIVLKKNLGIMTV